MSNNKTAKVKKQSGARETWRLFLRNRTAVIGLVVIIIFALVAIFAEQISPFKNGIDHDMENRLQLPSSEHWFGTDEFGRDEFTRVIHGARRSLSLGIVTTACAIIIGGFLGAACGYYGGALDAIVLRICDIFNCVPTFLFSLAVVAALGANLVNLLLAITIASIPKYIRMVRSVILSISQEDFIEAAHACGSSDMFIIMRHILPNAMGPIIVQASMSVADMMITAAGLSFIGLGIQPPTPEWGSMLSSAREYMRQFPYLLIFPGLAIAISALALNLIGDGLRDAIDPRLKE